MDHNNKLEYLSLADNAIAATDEDLEALEQLAGVMQRSDPTFDCVYTKPYKQLWRWHGPMSKTQMSIISRAGDLIPADHEWFLETIPEEFFTPDTLTAATSVYFDALCYVDSQVQTEDYTLVVNAICVAKNSTSAFRREAKILGLAHLELSAFSLIRDSFNKNIRALF